MDTLRVYAISFAKVYPLYVAKAEKKGRTKSEVDEVIRWLTGYSQKKLEAQIARKKTSKPSMRRPLSSIRHALSSKA